MRSVKFTKRAEKSVNNLIKRSPQIARLIANQIELLREDPKPNYAIKLEGYPCYRCRVKNFRIIYEFDDSFLHITIIANRNHVYRKVREKYAK